MGKHERNRIPFVDIEGVTGSIPVAPTIPNTEQEKHPSLALGGADRRSGVVIDSTLHFCHNNLSIAWAGETPKSSGCSGQSHDEERTMARRVLSTLIVAAVSGAVGLGAGVYAAPSDKAEEFRAFIDSKLGEINGLLHREQAAITPKAEPPAPNANTPEPEATPKEMQSAVPAPPASDTPASDAAAGQKDMPDTTAESPGGPAESASGQAAPVADPASGAPVTSAAPVNAEEAPAAKPAAKKAPAAKPHKKPPVKKPKKKPARHHPQAEPAEQAPPAEEAPAQ